MNPAFQFHVHRLMITRPGSSIDIAMSPGEYANAGRKTSPIDIAERIEIVPLIVANLHCLTGSANGKLLRACRFPNSQHPNASPGRSS